MYENLAVWEDDPTGELDLFACDLGTGRTFQLSFDSPMQTLYAVYGVDIAFTELGYPFFAKFLLDTQILVFLYFLG